MVFIKKKNPDLIDLKLSSLKKIFQSGLILEMKAPDFFSWNYGTKQVFEIFTIPVLSKIAKILKVYPWQLAKQLNPELVQVSLSMKSNCRSLLYWVYNSAWLSVVWKVFFLPLTGKWWTTQCHRSDWRKDKILVRFRGSDKTIQCPIIGVQ